ncbi:hypothetical protein QT974_26890 [Microcoleus sp. herbarium12]
MLKTEVGESRILAAWIVRSGETFPRLTSCYQSKNKVKTMKTMKTIKDLDIVALTEDLEATHFETKQIIKLSFMTSRNSGDGI